MSYDPTTYCQKCGDPHDVYTDGLCEACNDEKITQHETKLYPRNIVEAVEYIRLRVMQYPSKHTTFDSVKCAEKLIDLIKDKENNAKKLEKLISAANYMMDTLDTIQFRDAANMRLHQQHPSYEKLKQALEVVYK